jgi:cell division protein FtsB
MENKSPDIIEALKQQISELQDNNNSLHNTINILNYKIKQLENQTETKEYLKLRKEKDNEIHKLKNKVNFITKIKEMLDIIIDDD